MGCKTCECGSLACKRQQQWRMRDDFTCPLRGLHRLKCRLQLLRVVVVPPSLALGLQMQT
jgi:hypothetical protein